MTDEDNNGVPDYLDRLLIEDASGNIIPTDDASVLQDHARASLDTLQVDTDNDGIPDSDDAMDTHDSATDFMGALGQINEAIDDIAGEIDSLIE